MGRKRLEESEKKVNVKLCIKKEYLDILKDQNINISKLLEEKIEEFLKERKF